MYLAKPSEVVEAMAISPGGTGPEGGAKMALSLVGPIIAARIDSLFSRLQTTDKFQFVAANYGASFLPECRLTTGLLDKEESIVVSVDGAAVDPSSFMVKYDEGVVSLLVQPARSVDITYISGFDTAAEQVYSGVPDWLRAAAIMSSVYYLRMSPAQVSNTKRPSILELLSPLRVEISRLLNPRVRPRHHPILFPYWSVQQEV